MASSNLNYYLIFVLLLHSWSAFSQDKPEYGIFLIPDSLSNGSNAVIRLIEREFTVKSENEAILKEHRVVSIFNDSSPYDLLVLSYSPYEKIKRVRGNIYDANGELLREVEKNEIKDVSAISDFSIYEDDRVKYLDIDHSNYPYTVEFEYEKTFNNLMGYPAWDVLEYATGLQTARFKLTMPGNFNISYNAFNFNSKPIEEISKSNKALSWNLANLKPINWEPYSPPKSEVLPILFLSPHNFKVENYAGSMADWKSFGIFMNLLAKEKDELSPQMKAKVAEIINGASDEQTKIDRLYSFMQSNMRYVSVQLGIGGWQPFDAKYVEQNKYGDCKALTNYMKSLLKEAGITAYPVLVQGGPLRMEASPDFATSSAFNHMILHVPSQNYWLECTRNDFPANYLGSFTANRNALLLTETGGKIARTPVYPPSANLEESSINIELLPNGAANIEINSKFQGESHEHLRDAKTSLSEVDLKKEIQGNTNLPSLEINGLILNVEADKPAASLHYSLKVPRYSNKASKRLFVPINAVHPFGDVPPQVEKRKLPVSVDKGYAEAYLFKFTLPTGYDLESAPLEGVHIQSDFGSYDLTCEINDKEISVNRKLVINTVRLAAERYQDWRNFYKEIAKADGAKLVFVEKK